MWSRWVVVAVVTTESVEATPPLWFHTSASIPMPWPSSTRVCNSVIGGAEKHVWEERLPVSLYTATSKAHLLYNYHPHIWYDNLEGFRSTSRTA